MKAGSQQFEIFATVEMPQRLVMLGCGAIGSGVLQLLFRHIKVSASQVVVLSARHEEHELVERHGVQFVHAVLDESNFRDVLSPHVKAGDVFVNLSSCVSSIDVILFCQERGAAYVDSSNETWNDSPDELHQTWGRYVSKEARLKKVPGQPTALMSHGANPGMVNHFVKHGLMVLAREEFGPEFATPSSQEEWAQLAKRLEVQLIQISERDTQKSSIARRPSEFTCTWCVSAMMDETSENSQVPLGTHEPSVPVANRPGATVKHGTGAPPTWFSDNMAGNNTVKSWNPVCGPFLGNLIPHDETFSMCRYLTPADGSYRPTLYFAYQPCDDALLSQRDWFARYPAQPSGQRLLLNDIVSGADTLGVLICRRGRNKSLWYGSLLGIDEARSRLEGSSATTLSVVATVLAGLAWVIRNPRAGFVEPDDVPHEQILPVILPYISPMVQQFTDWTPLPDHEVRDDMWCLKHALSDAK